MGHKNLAEESPTTSPPGPPTLTTYADIPLDGTPGITGIFFPDGYKPADTVDVILYLHGLPTPCGGKTSDTIRETWANKYFPLRQLTNDGSKKNVVLVAPSLDGGANSGNLMAADKTNGGDKYLTAVMAHINERVKKAPFQWTGGDIAIGSIILAGHSGGGKTILPLAERLTIGKVCECWGLDSLYSNSKRWVTWANSGAHKFTLFWTKMGATNSQHYGYNIDQLQDALKDKLNAAARNNVLVEFAEKPKVFINRTDNHCAVPSTFWKELLSKATCLTDK